MFTISAAALDFSALYEWIARVGAGLTVWASMKAQKAHRKEDTRDLDTRVNDLRWKVRHPWQYRVKQIGRWFREEI